MTVPLATAAIGVPVGAAMSIPSCIRPQRHPKPLVSVPDVGQMKPDADGCPEPVEDCEDALRDWAAWIRAASCALSRWRLSTCSRSSASCDRTDESTLRLSARAAASAFWSATRRSRTRRCSSTRASTAAVVTATSFRVFAVRARVSLIATRAARTWAAMRLSCRPTSRM